MSTIKATVEQKNDLDNPQYYFNRELSWLEFNNRVLSEGLDERNPLLERLKFLAIFSDNLDEFFMVRVAGLKQQVEAGVTKLSFDGRSPSHQLVDIYARLKELVQRQDQHFQHTLKPCLAEKGIHLVDYLDLNREQRNYLHNFYEESIFPVLTPLAVDPSHPFPHISNLSLNLAVVIKEPGKDEQERFARVKVPKNFPRFIQLPTELCYYPDQEAAAWVGVPLEQVISHNLDSLFPAMDIQECYSFRVTRNASLSVEEDEADDLMIAIEEQLHMRRFSGSVVRLEIHHSMPEDVRQMLMQEMELEETDVYEVEGLIGLNSLFSFLGLPMNHLKDKPWKPLTPAWLDAVGTARAADNYGPSIFELIRQSDRLLHHPYHSFASTVQAFIEQASQDPKVLAIKMTLYRTSGDSPIIQALIDAVRNGIQVAVLVELKARFDEENNINWARTLEQKGIHVVYGLAGLKTHTKVVLVVREEKKKIRRYVHIGTGNYNPKTAGLYTDLGLLSCREDLGADLTELFNFLTGYSRQNSYRKLLVAPVTLRSRMVEMLEREMEQVKTYGSGRVVAKMNSLVDVPMIQALYRASQAGVKIDLIIRGICCLRPGVPGLSENINVVSVIGRFLEHSRIFYFQNAGNEEMYIGSADWMTRNLSRRVEAVTPVEDPKLIGDLNEILGIMLSDNRLAWELQPDGKYLQRQPTDGDRIESTHDILMEMTLKETQDS
ncbi:polyphosphate kinase 1 [[Limnothrix rosea] IAM M-220]|uniref:polyphosphate kinase 1 n=1 Tax=[Limnothrix rosea] IAM M-220 TaxID=454133 RepID=UPI00095A1115|nr:polyphosphate kinase 1 [[Limnothrix rosea] IAM M-220]OKH16949.1 RNA degradosome polyphosphate kinase [[Limnothrix rosea] IAM M-220]